MKTVMLIGLMLLGSIGFSQIDTSEITWLNETNRDQIKYLNYLRQHPLKRFKLCGIGFWYNKCDTLAFDEELNKHARDHVIRMASKGRIFHSRKRNKLLECCYGGGGVYYEFIDAYLIDEGIPSKGHRKALLDKFDKSTKVGSATILYNGDTYNCMVFK